MDEVQNEQNEDICWGRNPVFSMLEGAPDKCSKVLVSKGVQPHIKTKLQELCKSANVVLQSVDQITLDRVTNKENHQGVVAYISPVKLYEIYELLEILPKAPEPVMLVLCDHIQDPHNLGAVIRTAEIAGASAVIIPKRGGCLPTGTVVKTSAGAALRLPIAKMGNVSQTINVLQEKGYWTVGLSMEGHDSLFKEDIPLRTAFVIGAEGEGLGNVVSKSCDELRYIPMKGETGSLNASVAASLAMFEWTRSINKCK
ncbi:MAG: 23S rRNA (guanosine(2251)-2'-O)-methyltransferase RlmB [Synergistaceae bacterium]